MVFVQPQEVGEGAEVAPVGEEVVVRGRAGRGHVQPADAHRRDHEVQVTDHLPGTEGQK